jgi:DNA-binding MarR family transcriptional regulator
MCTFQGGNQLIFQDQNTQTLIALGLTILEARVYLALAKAGKATIAATLSKTLKVGRPDVHRTLAKLQVKLRRASPASDGYKT